MCQGTGNLSLISEYALFSSSITMSVMTLEVIFFKFFYFFIIILPILKFKNKRTAVDFSTCYDENQVITT